MPSTVGENRSQLCVEFVPKVRPWPTLRRSSYPDTVAPVQDFDVSATAERLTERGGGYDVVHTSPGLEVGVYVLSSGEGDKQVPHALDEIYVVLDGEGEVEVAGDRRPVRRGEGIYVGAGVEHRFYPYDELTLLVVFNGPHSFATTAP
jgi:mannose-6-phosphate isomerase-like protein (cupin superfamily)